jgi:transposase-like protein
MHPRCPKNAWRQRQNVGSTNTVGHGSFPVRCARRRRYRCLTCGGTLSRRIDTAYYRLHCSSSTFDRVASLSVEGMSRAATARVEDDGWNTANRWLVKAAAFVRRFNHIKTRDVEFNELRSDEIRTFAPD